MAKTAVSAAEKAGKILSSDAGSKALRGSVWRDMQTLREGASVAKSGRWQAKGKAGSAKKQTKG